jgi:uncharacterized protein YjdB
MGLNKEIPTDYDDNITASYHHISNYKFFKKEDSLLIYTESYSSKKAFLSGGSPLIKKTISVSGTNSLMLPLLYSILKAKDKDLENSEDIFDVNKIEGIPEKLTLEVGESTVITAEISPSHATNKELSWRSSNIDVATVSSGNIIGISEGRCSITVCSEFGTIFRSCEVTVGRHGEEIIAGVIDR